MNASVISGTGLWTPRESISNEELVASQLASAQRFNREHAAAIEAGEIEKRALSSVPFIVKASGVQSRYVIEKSGVLDPGRMHPRLPLRGDDEPSIQCEISLLAIHEALERAGREPAEVDAVLVACSNLQRAYPAVAVEVQDALGAGGWAYDLNVACSSATFGIQAAADAVASGHARCAVVVNPEITSGHTNFELRDSHFIFGDACTAIVVERAADCRSKLAFEIVGTRLQTRFSNNIRNNFGFLNRSEIDERSELDRLFRQNGRHVFREVCPMVAKHIAEHLAEHQLPVEELRCLWLHQANLAMNELIARTLLGRTPLAHEAPVVLDEYANTSSAGSVIAFHKHHEGLEVGDLGVLCSFGAGYSVGSVLLRRTR